MLCKGLVNFHEMTPLHKKMHIRTLNRFVTGMVQAWVAHFVTPLKCTYNKYDWRVTSQKPHKKHKSPNQHHHHHGGGAARPSSGVDLMNPRRPRGGCPCACSFRCRRQSNLIDLIKLMYKINKIMFTSMFNRIRARPPATMVAKTASLVVGGGQ